MAYAPPVSSLMTLNVLWSRSTPTTFPSPGPRMIGTAVSVSGRNLPIGSTSNPVARACRQSGGGSMPLLRMSGAASGDDMNFTSSRAASRSFETASTPTAKST